MATQTTRTISRLATAVLLLLAGAGVIVAYAASNGPVRSIGGLPQAAATGACLLSSIAILGRSRRPDAWRSATWLGLGCLGLSMLNGVFLAFVLSGPTPAGAVANSDDVAFLAVGVLFLLAAGTEFGGHLPRTVRREILADTALLSVATSTMLLLYLQSSGADAGTTASAAVFALLVSAGFSSTVSSRSGSTARTSGCSLR
jgi:hypothetical protein